MCVRQRERERERETERCRERHGERHRKKDFIEERLGKSRMPL